MGNCAQESNSASKVVGMDNFATASQGNEMRSPAAEAVGDSCLIGNREFPAENRKSPGADQGTPLMLQGRKG